MITPLMRTRIAPTYTPTVKKLPFFNPFNIAIGTALASLALISVVYVVKEKQKKIKE